MGEMVAAEGRLAALRDDVVAFGAACGLTLDPWQREVVASRAPRIALACGRQVGKSTVAALLALHTAVFTPGATVLVLSAALRQSQELFGKVCALLAGVAAHSGGQLGVPVEAETQLTLKLANGARIIALPGVQSTVRSYSAVSLLVLDEAAHVANELVYATLPMLAVSNGRLIMLSSCYGKRGVFWETWSAAERGEVELVPWLRVRVPATECPRISADFLAEMHGKLGDWWYRSEFLAEFLDDKTAAFSQEDIDRAFAEDYQTWNLRPWTAEDHAREREAAAQQAHAGPRPRLQWEHDLPDDASGQGDQYSATEDAWTSFRARTASR
jgi:hypothetical protein